MSYLTPNCCSNIRATAYTVQRNAECSSLVDEHHGRGDQLASGQLPNERRARAGRRGIETHLRADALVLG